MRRRLNNMKRGTALLGVVLALLSGVQNTRLFCQLGDCAATGCTLASLEPLRHQHADGQAETPSCSDRCQSVTCSADGMLVAQRNESADEDVPCPCSSDCRCHQAPQPLELPRGEAEVAEALLLAWLSAVRQIPTDTETVANPVAYSSQPSLLGNSSSEQCALLCRFLI